MMRIVFCGTPEFAVPSLRRLLATPEFAVEIVISQPDRPRGRGRVISAPPVKEVAVEAGIRIYQPERIKSPEAYELLREINPDAVVIIAYGQIVPQRLLEIGRFGWINLHGSLLPEYRGAAPIAWAIINGETRTGLTTMQVDAGMDTGPILLKQEIEIGPDETAPELSKRMAEAGAPLVVETLQKLAGGELRGVPQDASQATYARILKKGDGRIDWKQNARDIYNRMRGLAPWPGAFTMFRGSTCHVWGRPAATEPNLSGAALTGAEGSLLLAGSAVEVICGAKTRLAVEAVQLEGRRRITAREFVNGMRVQAGERFE